MARKTYRMTAEERAAQEERRRFIDAVVSRAAAEASIENTLENRRAYIDRVLAEVAAREQARAGTEGEKPDPAV